MIKLNFEPPEGEKWNIEFAKAYYLQQIALQLEELNNTMKEQNFWQELHSRDTDEIGVMRMALELMTSKQEIIGLFEEKESMALSDFARKVSALKIWGDRDTFGEAIKMTDFLDLRVAGNGFRVWLIN
jgi:hypothetical protein